MRREGGFVSDGSEEDGREVVRMVEGGMELWKSSRTRERQNTRANDTTRRRALRVSTTNIDIEDRRNET